MCLADRRFGGQGQKLRYRLRRAGTLEGVRDQKLDHIDKTETAVKERLTKEINYWGHRADELRVQEQAGKTNARLNSDEARKRSLELQDRGQKRIEELQLERQLSPLPPVILGSVLVVPAGLLSNMTGRPSSTGTSITDRQAVAAKAREIVMEVERSLGFEPVDLRTGKTRIRHRKQSSRRRQAKVH